MRPAWPTEQVTGQPGLQRNSASKGKTKTRKKKKEKERNINVCILLYVYSLFLVSCYLPPSHFYQLTQTKKYTIQGNKFFST